MRVNIIIEKDKNGYYAFCPDLTGCHSQGDTLDETIENVKEAIELYLEVLSPEEREDYFAQEIITASVEVNVA